MVWKICRDNKTHALQAPFTGDENYLTHQSHMIEAVFVVAAAAVAVVQVLNLHTDDKQRGLRY